MGKRVDFERLRTMEDVVRERMRIRYDIKQREHMLKNDMDRVSEVFSVNYWTNIIEIKVAEMVEQITSNVASKIRGVASGWGIVDNLLGSLGRRFGKTARPVREYYVEEDIYFDPDDELYDDFIDENRSC